MTHLFIINPAAGSRDRTDEYREKIKAACESRHLQYRIQISQAPGDCRRLARAAAETGKEYKIYACGGDGTLNEVADGAAGFYNVSVTVFSCGSSCAAGAACSAICGHAGASGKDSTVSPAT